MSTKATPRMRFYIMASSRRCQRWNGCSMSARGHKRCELIGRHVSTGAGAYAYPDIPTSMRRAILIFAFLIGICTGSQAHNVGNAITWNREISRIIYQRCASCHRDGGTAFSLMKYQEVQPRAVEIKEAVLSRRMPPWGAVKG